MEKIESSLQQWKLKDLLSHHLTACSNLVSWIESKHCLLSLHLWTVLSLKAQNFLESESGWWFWTWYTKTSLIFSVYLEKKKKKTLRKTVCQKNKISGKELDLERRELTVKNVQIETDKMNSNTRPYCNAAETSSFQSIMN